MVWVESFSFDLMIWLIAFVSVEDSFCRMIDWLIACQLFFLHEMFHNLFPVKANQDLLRQQDIQTQKNLQSKNALVGIVRQKLSTVECIVKLVAA